MALGVFSGGSAVPLRGDLIDKWLIVPVTGGWLRELQLEVRLAILG